MFMSFYFFYFLKIIGTSASRINIVNKRDFLIKCLESLCLDIFTGALNNAYLYSTNSNFEYLICWFRRKAELYWVKYTKY